MPEPRIQQHFFEGADLLYQVAEHLSRPLADAAQLAVGCLTSGGKLLLAGTGGAQALARLMGTALQQRLERERPPLAAVVLDTEACPYPVPGADAQDLVLARALAPLSAIGQPGDVLVLFSLSGDDPIAAAAIEEAHAKDMPVVLFGAGLSAAWPGALAESDAWIAVPHERALRAMEVQLLAMHALCDAIDMLLLGDADAP